MARTLKELKGKKIGKIEVPKPQIEQIKLFSYWGPDVETIEQEVNDFLVYNDGQIVVTDIQYHFIPDSNTGNHTRKDWSVMVVYKYIENLTKTGNGQPRCNADRRLGCPFDKDIEEQGKKFERK